MNRLNLEPLWRAVDILELARQIGAQLKKSGKAWHSACPLHSGDNPTAFVIWPETQTWRCFTGCNHGGDAIDLVMCWKGYEFLEALRWLADWARVDLTSLNWSPEAIAAHEQQMAVSDLLQRAVQVYQAQLWAMDGEGQPVNTAADYALHRGFSAAHVKAAQWGYSQANETLLHVLTQDAPEMLSLARELGLIRADGRDFCANANGAEVSPEGWLIYPHLHRGKVVYLSARALNATTKDKSRNLPGARQIYRADADLRLDGNWLRLRDDGLVLVEGPADAESCRAWRWPAWAMCGAPIDDESNPELMAALRQKAQRATLYVALSNDTAGHQFADKISAALGPLTRLVFWPKRNAEDQKSDANDCLQRGFDEEQIGTLFENSPTYLDQQIEHVARLRDVRKKAEGLERLAALVTQLSVTERKVYISKVTTADLDISRREFEKMVADRLPKGNAGAVEIRGGCLTYFGEPLINGVPRVTSELIVDDGQNAPSIEYHLVGRTMDGHDLPPIDVPAEEFDSMKWIGKSWGARMYPLVGGGKLHLLKRAILETSLKDMRTERVHTFTGFCTVNGRGAFLTATGAITANGMDRSVRVDLPNNLALYALPEPTTGMDLIIAFRTSLEFLQIAHHLVSVPIWAAMYQAVLTSIKPLNAVLQIYGPTQSKKSTYSHVGLSFYGPGFIDGRQYRAPRDWISSTADLEGTMFTCKDVPLIIDDYAPQFSSAQESKTLAKTAHAVVRMVGNRSSRGRRNADMSARALLPPRGSVLMTAEQPLTGQSIVGRTVVVPIEYGAVDVDRLSAAQDVHERYSVAMAGYVQWLIVNWERVQEESSRLIAAWLTSLRGAFPNQDRLADYYAALRLGLHWALLFGESIGAIDEALDLENGYAIDLLTLLESQSVRVAEQSPVVKFFAALDDLLAGGQVAILPRMQKNAVGEEAPTEAPHGTALIGWKLPSEKRVWLLTAPALIAVKEYWSGLDERFDTLIDALRREMWQHGYIPERDDRQIELTKWINKHEGNKRVLIVDAEKVLKDFGVDLIREDTGR